jgi:hypothetical protein
MRKLLVVYCCLVSACLAQQTTTGSAQPSDMSDKSIKIGEPFRSMAEDVIGCLDALTLAYLHPDSVFIPQDMRCAEMAGKLERTSTNKREKAVAFFIKELRGSADQCRFWETRPGGGDKFASCMKENANKRTLIIDAAELRN